ncbi:hypothetical protein SUGI_0886800 [Cryptomeria japonica]|uniref:probable inactive receptor kinase At5g58300 n=1 Tax=Cryptomeria japonica TaxID=3369 RepID=UPI002414AD95|nr:probable inactive receptor kinase At5g58300 [Cryptomeria japonica]GLJ42766.1 hypothetical protein SUGI_0886800 [Cryptomeria japonica]
MLHAIIAAIIAVILIIKTFIWTTVLIKRWKRQRELMRQKVFKSLQTEKTAEVAIPVVGIPVANQPAQLIFNDETDQRFKDVQSLVENATWIELGRGTLGPLFKWVLKGGAIVVARKLDKITVTRQEFAKRLLVLKTLQHPNLLPLRSGFFYGEIPFLIFDYLCLGSLEDLLHGKEKSSFTALNWPIRACVSLCIARGIAAIHRSPEGLVCGVVKSSNVLLKNDFKGCLSGYELPSLVPAAAIIKQNPGAVAPELLHTNTPVFTHSSDVYSFGVCLLELITGRRPRTRAPDGREIDLREFVQSAHNEIFDPAVDRDGSSEEEMSMMVGIAKECLCDVAAERPTMSQVVVKLKMLRTHLHHRNDSIQEME